MASVRRRDPNDPKSPWVVEYTDKAGVRRRKTPKSGLKKDAEKLRQNIEQELNEGVHAPESETVTVGKAADEFINDCERRWRIGRRMTGQTLSSYRTGVGHIKPKFGKLLLTQLTHRAVQEWADDLAQNYKAMSVRTWHGVFYRVIEFAVRKGWIKRNPIKDVKTELPAAERRLFVPSKDELIALLKAASTRFHGEQIHTVVNRQVLVALCLFGGLRCGEVFGLQWENVDLENGRLSIKHSQSWFDGLKAPKTAAGVRSVPISAPMLAALRASALYRNIEDKRHRAEQGRALSDHPAAINARFRRRMSSAGEVVGQIEKPTGYVIKSHGERQMQATSMSYMWAKLMKHAGLLGADGKPLFSVHTLRHAAASLFIDQRISLVALKTVMGHASVTTTLNVYGHMLPDDDTIAIASGNIASAFGATEMRLLPASD